MGNARSMATSTGNHKSACKQHVKWKSIASNFNGKYSLGEIKILLGNFNSLVKQITAWHHL